MGRGAREEGGVGVLGRGVGLGLRGGDRGGPAGGHERPRPEIGHGAEGGRAMSFTAEREPEIVFQPPEWDWSKPPGEVGWWVRPEWREALIGPGRAADRRVAGRREAGHDQDGAEPRGLSGRPGGRVGLRQAFPGAERRKKLRQWFRRGKGRNEAKRAAKLAGHRRAHDHAHRPGRAAQAGLPVRELSDHPGHRRARSPWTSSSRRTCPGSPSDGGRGSAASWRWGWGN